jgi:hypothetical protein
MPVGLAVLAVVAVVLEAEAVALADIQVLVVSAALIMVEDLLVQVVPVEAEADSAHHRVVVVAAVLEY